jgi:hypothetical protein
MALRTLRSYALTTLSPSGRSSVFLTMHYWHRHKCDRRNYWFRSNLLTGVLQLLVVASPSLAHGQDISLNFDPTTPVAGTLVSFNSGDSGVVSNDVVAGFQGQTAKTQDGKYVVTVDMQSFRRDKFHRFSFDCYVKAATDRSAASVHKFTVWENPIGTFSDFIGSVTAHISGASGTDIVVMQLPQHSDDSANATIVVPPNPYPVPMGHSSRMELGLSNNLSSLHLSINPAISVVATKCPECWGSLTAKVLHDHLGRSEPTSLIIDLQPNSLEAFKRNLVVFDSTSSQEMLVGTVTSQSDQGGSDVEQSFRIPVRFTPPGRFLILSILCGALIGCAIRYLISIQTPPRLSLPEAVIVAATAGVAWLIAFGLFATKTKATILGYDLDPTQVVPAGLITLLAAGGTTFSRRLAELLGGKS